MVMIYGHQVRSVHLQYLGQNEAGCDSGLQTTPFSFSLAYFSALLQNPFIQPEDYQTMSNEDSIKPGLAFGIVTASGLCTALGSTVVLFPSLVRFANRKALASGLAFDLDALTRSGFHHPSSVDVIKRADRRRKTTDHRPRIAIGGRRFAAA